MFDGITQGGTRQVCGLLLQELGQDLSIHLPYLSQHPSDGFVNQIVWMGGEMDRQVQGIRKISRFDKGPGRYDADPLFPKTLALS